MEKLCLQKVHESGTHSRTLGCWGRLVTDRYHQVAFSASPPSLLSGNHHHHPVLTWLVFLKQPRGGRGGRSQSRKSCRGPGSVAGTTRLNENAHVLAVELWLRKQLLQTGAKCGETRGNVPGGERGVKGIET